MNYYKSTLGYISKKQLFGFIPLDVICHGVIGTLITVIGLKKKWSFKKTFSLVLFLALFKELQDSFVMTYHWTESIKDIFVTIIYPVILYGARKLIEFSENQE